MSDALSEVEWNPLTDDGDAFRLAVVLGINFHEQWQWNGYSAYTPERVIAGQQLDATGNIDITAEQGFRNMETRSVETYANHNLDKNAATRCAIVRAAAAIGKAMP